MYEYSTSTCRVKHVREVGRRPHTSAGEQLAHVERRNVAVVLRFIVPFEAESDLTPGAMRVRLVNDRGRRIVRRAAVRQVISAFREAGRWLGHMHRFRDRNHARAARAHQRLVAVHVAHARRAGRREASARASEPVVQRGHTAAGEGGGQCVGRHRETMPDGCERLLALFRLQCKTQCTFDSNPNILVLYNTIQYFNRDLPSDSFLQVIGVQNMIPERKYRILNGRKCARLFIVRSIRLLSRRILTHVARRAGSTHLNRTHTIV